jgi:hypothetical protein
MAQKQTKSRKRVADHGEVFTAEREVNAMLDLVKPETERIDSRFLEPACGDGNFLAEILRRKLAVVTARYAANTADWERYAVIAASSIYGVELLADNCEECRARLYRIWDAEHTAVCKKDLSEETRGAVQYILRKNILCGDALTLTQANGSPIIFAEWSEVTPCILKRRDFALADMLNHDEEAPSLFTAQITEDDEWVLKPVKEYPPAHFRRIAEND